MFARYPHKRPQHLIVEDDGSISLTSLMDAWGTERQYSEKTIIESVQRHMYHEDRPDDLRFAILEAEDLQRLRIKVMPSRGKSKHSCKTRPYPLMLADENVGSDPFDQRKHKRARLDRCDKYHHRSSEWDCHRAYHSRHNGGHSFSSRQKDRDMVKYGLMMYRLGQCAERKDSPRRRNRFSRCSVSPRRVNR